MESERTAEVVQEDDIGKLLGHFAKNSHRVKTADIKGETIMERCTLLFGKDYKFTIVPNFNGELCGHYPMKLIITEFERDAVSSTEHVESRHNQQLLTQRIKNARCARCRSRFVIPVIFYQGKHICRSATLSGAAEMFGRSTTDYLLSSQSGSDAGRLDMFDKFRGHDIQLLKYFDVGYICDLMVEKKKTKFGMPITSSEKVDKENRYSDFSILCMPYPGCEFFRDWKNNSYLGEATVYDWGQALNDSKLDLPNSALVENLNIEWFKYTEWSLTELTQNYLKLLFQYIKKGDSGLLVHCISGWDRTPLFISLLRLSMWADGVVHQSLSPTEILYLTLGYDWYLFGHDLPDRLSTDEEVMYFCFKFLKDLASDEYSVLPRTHVNGNSSPTPQEGVNGPRPLSTNQTAPQHTRQGSDTSLGIHGVLLADELMTFPAKGSTSSLNSISSMEAGINFTLGVHEEEEEGEGETIDAGAEGDLPPLNVNLSHRRSLSPASRMSPTMRHSSPVSAAGRRRRSSDGQPLSVHSNHFVGSPLARPSSPMQVPQRDASEGVQSSYPNSVGSWQIIPSADNLRSLATNSSNSQSSAGRSSHVSSCHDALEINMSSTRWQRLDAVSRIFHTAYASSVQSKNVRQSSGSGLTSFFDRFAEQVGLKGAKSHGASGVSRSGV
ncbi:myotubularin-related protein 14 [Aplysia californica]|uniref:Myotubularin-related protein 14 n=1 Tax=Aplysia californica TaxID=6500 RepID=A0ABM0ZYW1_APLCA|nr:myotubularin-related protein 14 [Aplysia californica]